MHLRWSFNLPGDSVKGIIISPFLEMDGKAKGGRWHCLPVAELGFEARS